MKASRSISNLLAAAVFFALMTTSLMLAAEYMHREGEIASIKILENKMQYNSMPLPENVHEVTSNNSVVVNGLDANNIVGVLVVRQKGNPVYYKAKNTLEFINKTAFSLNKNLVDPSSDEVLLVMRDGSVIKLSKETSVLNSYSNNEANAVTPEESSFIQSILGINESYRLFIEDNKKIINFTTVKIALPLYVDVRVYNIKGHITWYWWGPDWWVKADYYMVVKVDNKTIDERSGELYVHRTGYVNDAEDSYVLGPTSWITVTKYGDFVFKIKVEIDVQLHGGVSTWGQSSPNPYGYAGGRIYLECIYTGKDTPIIIYKKRGIWTDVYATIDNSISISSYYEKIGDLYVYYDNSKNIMLYEEHDVLGNSQVAVEQISKDPYVVLTIAIIG